MSHTFFVKYQGISPQPFGISRSNFQRYLLCSFNSRDIILLASSDDDEHMLMKQKKLTKIRLYPQTLFVIKVLLIVSYVQN